MTLRYIPFTVSEFAEKTGLTESSVTHWIKRHPEFEAKYCTKQKSRGRGGYRIYIEQEALPVFLSTKDNYRGGGKRVSDVTSEIQTAKIKKAQERVGETAAASVLNRQMAVSSMSPIQALQQAVNFMAAQEEKIQQLEQRQLQVDQKILQLTNSLEGDTKLTGAQRARMNDRVRFLAFHISKGRNEDASFWFRRLWRKLHDCMKKVDLEAYRFEDFPTAMETLKTFYIEYGAIW